jgi:hypothetical protein
MTDKEREEAMVQICESYDKRLISLRAALDGDTNGYVFCWDKYGLGVKITGDIPATVGVEHATVVKHSDRRKFQNGSREPALLMPRSQALRAALRTVSESYEWAKKHFAGMAEQ